MFFDICKMLKLFFKVISFLERDLVGYIVVEILRELLKWFREDNKLLEY